MNIKKLFIAPAMLAAFAAGMNAGTVDYANGVLNIKFDGDGTDKMTYRFSKCMANELFTFSHVYVNNQLVNSSLVSDNIGPFLITSRGWTGGNHLTGAKQKTAKTIDYSIEINGETLGDKAADIETDRVDVYVTNELYDPANLSSLFATETVHYIVMGNSIQVEASHKYHNTTPFTIDRYYGMQSMMDGETRMLTPQGAYSTWTAIGKVSQFTKGEYPDFCLFVEHSPRCYQAAYMTREGIGDRHLVRDNDVVFIGNSWSKSYHKTIGGAILKDGDETYWKGVYTWFKKPMTDTIDDGGDFVYSGYFDGAPAFYRASATQPVQVVAGVEDVTVDSGDVIATVGDGCVVIAEDHADAAVYTVGGQRVAAGAGVHRLEAGIYLVSDTRGNSMKVAVK